MQDCRDGVAYAKRWPRMMTLGIRRFFHGFLVLFSASGLSASERPIWNQFRGPNGAGVAETARPPLALGGSNTVWSISIPPGLSSPVLSENRLFLTAVENGRLLTLALETKSGRELWRRLAPEVPLEKVHEISSPATPTPYVDAHRLYVYFGSYGLLCYDHDGKELWSKPIPTPKSLYGMAASPIGCQNRLILVLDTDDNLPDSRLSQSKILALDKATGDVVWEAARPLVRSGWSTPILWDHADGKDLVVLGSGRVCGYDPESGAEKWFAPGFSRETIAVPVADHERVYVSASMLGGVADDQPDPEPFWVAMLHFDVNQDGKIEREEITRDFTFPFRPELPVGHPGFGLPLPSDETKRRERQLSVFKSVDKDGDGFWTQEEFIGNMSFRREKPRLMAIRPGGAGDISESHVAWQLHRSIPEIPSPLLYRDRLYLVRNGGILAAVNARDGSLLYNERLGAPGLYSASPVIANEHLYLVSNRGMVSVVKTGDDFQRVSQHDLGEEVMVTPGLDASTIYIRGAKRLFAFRDLQ